LTDLTIILSFFYTHI